MVFACMTWRLGSAIALKAWKKLYLSKSGLELESQPHPSCHESWNAPLHLPLRHFVVCAHMSSNPAVQRQMATRAKNKITHPGNVVKAGARNRRTTAEVEEERKAKAATKANLEAAKQRRIIRTAQFERDDMVRADALDATPRPVATLKPQGQVQNSPTPPNSASDIEMTDGCNFDNAEFNLPSADDSATECATIDSANDSLVESGAPKRSNVRPTKKAAKWLAQNESKGQQLEMVIDSEVDQRQQSKPKKGKGKAKVREEINIALKKMDRDPARENKSGERSTENKEGNVGEDPAPRSRNESENQVVAGNKRKLRREGAIADLQDVEIAANVSNRSSSGLINT